jgi:MoxR-like ATPase
MNSEVLARIKTNLGSVIFGQEQVIDELLISFLAKGHVLLEGVPGVAKTLTAKSLAQCLGLSFKRIQFTPDLMPSDVTGTSVLHDGKFDLIKGPIFSEIVVADEINRTPPKTQAALLEAMEERQVSIDGTTHQLANHFFVVATQNPIELEGTYPLPEAQLDRFLLRIKVGYPSESAERVMLKQRAQKSVLKAVITLQELQELQRCADEITQDETVVEYVLKLIRSTREHARIRLGASPRAAQALLSASRSRALMADRNYVTPDDVKAVAPSVLNHRLVLKAEAEIEGISVDDVIDSLLKSTVIPR